MTAADTAAGSDVLALWRELERTAALQCPACRGPLNVGNQQFSCAACGTAFPVESGVPLLMPPDEVVSVSGQVMRAFNLPASLKQQVETALTTLVKYKTFSHPEFANFFARIDPGEGQPRSLPLSVDETAAAVAKVECVTPCFADVLRTDPPEFRSIRLRNGSDRVLFTGAGNPLFLSYTVFTPAGEPVAVEAGRAPLPCALRPGGEVTVPVPIRLPPGAAGRFTVRFHFLLADRPVQSVAHSPRTWLSKVRDRFRVRARAVAPWPPTYDHWFDAAPLAEMTVTTAREVRFPCVRRGAAHEFDVAEDVARADSFLRDVIGDLRARGVSRPRILEIGAGVYPVALRACGEDATVVVSDISLVMQALATIMHANNPAVREGRAAFASFDAMHPPFRDGTFDVVCICAAFHHIPQPAGFLRTLAPLLSGHGRFVALREPCIVNPAEPQYLVELANGFNEQMFELAEWRDIVERSGFVFDRAASDFEGSLKFSARRA